MFYKQRTTYSFFIALFALASFLLILVALFSRHWTEATVERNPELVEVADKEFLVDQFGTNADGNNPGAFLGVVYFGLFGGCKTLNYGFGSRTPKCFSVYEEHDGVYSTFWLYIIVVLLCLAAIFALVTTIFGLVNTLILPIETLHGPVGLFIWNGLAILFSAVAVCIYTILYFVQIRDSLPIKEDEFFRNSDTSLGYAFWLAAGAAILSVSNILFIILAYSSMGFESEKKHKELYLASPETSYDIGNTMSY